MPVRKATVLAVVTKRPYIRQHSDSSGVSVLYLFCLYGYYGLLQLSIKVTMI